jgi:hypothetical protein
LSRDKPASVTEEEMSAKKLPLEGLTVEFLKYAARDYHDSSPLYEALSFFIAGDKELLEISSYGRSAIPNLFLGAVHYLLLESSDDPLAKYYPSLSNPVNTASDIFPLFRAFCIDHREEITEIVARRIVQTNEVSRCAYLYPAFVTASRMASQKPLSLIDIGTSAGLHLLWDFYAYDFGSGKFYGSQNSPVIIRSELRGDKIPKGLVSLPRIAIRCGIDLNPISPSDAESIRWLNALIWPEHKMRRQLLRSAIGILKREESAIELFKGDAADLLPSVLSKVTDDTVPCVFQTHVWRQLSPAAKNRLIGILEEFGKTRELYFVSALDQLLIERHAPDGRRSCALANYEQHGRWFEWLVND